MWTNGKESLVYNTCNFSRQIFKNHPSLKTIIDDLLITENLYTVTISEKLLNSKHVYLFVNYIVSSNSGKLTLNDGITEKSVELKPIYNEVNLMFFKNNLYIDDEYLSSVMLTKKDIFINQALNILNFGKIFVLPDESILTNMNNKPIGTIENIGLYDIVYNEIINCRSWLKTRNQKPCSDCIYQWLCPSTSNYELVIGKPNFYHIKS